jgi:hypothetical protein
MAASFLVHPPAFRAPLASGFAPGFTPVLVPGRAAARSVAGRRRRPLPTPSPRAWLQRDAIGTRARSGAGALLLAVSLVLLAVLVAPERPQDQEAICQRQAGVEACRVW